MALATGERLRREVDGVVCLATPSPFHAVGQWYLDFGQVSDNKVRTLLADRARQQKILTHAAAT
jgi:putative phosphoribosyl transferase